MTICIKSWADALANLPSRARWFPQGDAAIRQRNGSCDSTSALLGQTMEGLFMSKNKESNRASDGSPEFTSAGVPWSEVPEFARPHVAWIDGRHGSAQTSLPPVDVVPVPDILHRLPYLHEDRPRKTGPVDQKPCSMPQARGRGCETCAPALGSSVLTVAGSGP